MMKEKYAIQGMTCSACSAHVEKAVSALPGIQAVQVNLLQNSMVVDYDASLLDAAAIMQAVAKAGYQAQPLNQAKPAAEAPAELAKAEQQQMKHRLIWSVVFLVPLLYISMGSMLGAWLPPFLRGDTNAINFAMAQFLLTLPIAYLNRRYYQNGFRSLLKRKPTMDSLIAIGSAAAIIYGVYAILQIGQGLANQDFALVQQYHMDLYFESAAMILTLITIGKYLESRAKGKTSAAITKLMDLAAKTAVVERDGVEIEVPVEEVKLGDIVVVRTGATIPVDGLVVSGAATVDEAAISGESMPVEKSISSQVTGATISKSGFMKIEATHVGADTALAKIIQLVEAAAASKAPIAKLADRVSAVFVPVVIGIAVLATIVWLLLGHPFSFALSIGISVLVISCPCALGLATPTAIMVGVGKGAENGIFFRNAESLETAHLVTTVILDKTGTVTVGKPGVKDVFTAQGVSQQELLAVAAAAEKPSEHPLGIAILDYAKQLQIEIAEVAEFQQIAGQGLVCQQNGMQLLAGNAKLMQSYGIEIQAFAETVQAAAKRGQTPLYFARNEQLLGVITLADTIKETSAEAVAALQQMGIRVIMLTGDNLQTANAVAEQVGIQQVIAEVLPEQKEQIVRQQQQAGAKVAMVGDGINDAPALMRADVGIALGAGTDIAIESADIVLVRNDLLDAITAIQLSHATIRNIKQNLFWAFFYNVLGIPLAAGVFLPWLGWKLSPMFAAAAMSLSSLFVVSNALRLRFFRPLHTARPAIKQAPPAAEAANPAEFTALLHVSGMSCQHCKNRVEAALQKLPGVEACVDLEAGTVTVQTTEKLSLAELQQAVEDAGYSVTAATELA